jgi:large subunit ribosomal protein L4
MEVGFTLLSGGKGNQAVHETIVAHLANRRSGTACTKTMGEVAGTGKKPWRQKGTGRARSGSFASPLWVGGGVVFGPKPRDFGKKVPGAVRALALRKALSARLEAGEVIVVDALKLTAPKTREFVKVLGALQVKGSVLVVDNGEDRNLRLAARNVPDVDLTTGSNLNTYQVLRYERLVFTKPGFAQVEGRLK